MRSSARWSCGPGGGQVGAFVEARLERPLGLAPRLLRPLEVDLAGHVGRLGHDHDLVRPDLQEAAGDGEDLLGAALADAQLADAERADTSGAWCGSTPSSPSTRAA